MWRYIYKQFIVYVNKLRYNIHEMRQYIYKKLKVFVNEFKYYYFYLILFQNKNIVQIVHIWACYALCSLTIIVYHPVCNQYFVEYRFMGYNIYILFCIWIILTIYIKIILVKNSDKYKQYIIYKFINHSTIWSFFYLTVRSLYCNFIIFCHYYEITYGLNVFFEKLLKIIFIGAHYGVKHIFDAYCVIIIGYLINLIIIRIIKYIIKKKKK